MRRAFVIGLLCWVVALPAWAAPVADFSRVYAFGDSYTDNGAGYGATRAMTAHGVADARAKPGDLYWQQRWSNGPVTVEVLADTLDVPLSDYAIGGAKSGQDNYYAWMNTAQPTGTQAQIASYLAHQADGRADPDGLYFVFASANDFFAREDFDEPTPVDELAEQAAANVTAGVQALADAGARRVVVIGSVDLAHVPAVISGHDVADGRRFQKRFDKRLQTRLATLQAGRPALTTLWFDRTALAQKLRRHAEQNGLVDLDSPCQTTYPEAGERCEAPAEHYYWDEWHPTHHVHTRAGRAIAAAVEQTWPSAVDHRPAR